MSVVDGYGKIKMPECHNCNRELSDDQIEKVADLVIQKMTERAYVHVGKQVVGGASKFLFYVGAFFTAIYVLAKSKGWIS